MVLPIVFSVVRDKFRSTEMELGTVTFDGGRFDYGHLDVSASEEVKKILETSYVEAVGTSKKEGYGEHNVTLVERKPGTAEHMLAVSNHRLEGSDLHLWIDDMSLL